MYACLEPAARDVWVTTMMVVVADGLGFGAREEGCWCKRTEAKTGAATRDAKEREREGERERENNGRIKLEE